MEELTERLGRIEKLLLLQSKEVLNVAEAAMILGLSEDRLRHLVSDRKVPHYKSETGRVSFKKSELDTWRLGTRVPTQQEIDTQATTYIHTK